MKCSSRKNCNATSHAYPSSLPGLNEVQFPKELRLHGAALGTMDGGGASMKCSSRRNCDLFSGS